MQQLISEKAELRTDAALIRLFALLVLIPLILSGCATTPKAPPKPIPGKDGILIDKLTGAQDGFVITESVPLDAALQKSFQQAVGLMSQEKYEAAIALLTEIVKQAPNVSAPCINLAMAYERTGKKEEAEKYLQEALKLMPDHPVACNEYGLLLRKDGKFKEARQMYEKPLARFPNYYPIHRNLGILCDLYLGDLPCALAHYETYSEAMPDDEKVKLWIVDLKGRMGQE